jgi:hypothetical protein
VIIRGRGPAFDGVAGNKGASTARIINWRGNNPGELGDEFGWRGLRLPEGFSDSIGCPGLGSGVLGDPGRVSRFFEISNSVEELIHFSSRASCGNMGSPGARNSSVK